MDSALPAGLVSALSRARSNLDKISDDHVAISGRRRRRILEMTATGFVVEADDPSDLRGYVDILQGTERVARRLVVCAWAQDGKVGYEFKHDSDGDAARYHR